MVAVWVYKIQDEGLHQGKAHILIGITVPQDGHMSPLTGTRWLLGWPVPGHLGLCQFAFRAKLCHLTALRVMGGGR